MTVARVVTVGRRRFHVTDSACHRAFWDRLAQGHWEPQTFAVFDRFLSGSHSYLDVGAWIGPTILYGAQRAHVGYAIEPDPVARHELELNLALNPKIATRVVVSGLCVASQSGPVELHAGGMYASSGSRFGDSMTSLLPAADGGAAAVLAADGITLEEFSERYEVRDCNFIKMDVEGAEFSILCTHRDYWRRTRPTLYVSFHAPPAARREDQYRGSFDVLRSIYPHIYDATGRPLDLSALADGVADWTDAAPGSPWARLDETTGAGIVATMAVW
jgi:FkbM family methyltransferase